MIYQRATMHATVQEVAQAAMCCEKIAEYYTDVHKPTGRNSVPAYAVTLLIAWVIILLKKKVCISC